VGKHSDGIRVFDTGRPGSDRSVVLRYEIVSLRKVDLLIIYATLIIAARTNGGPSNTDFGTLLP
jgi:hypothetical protein